MQSMPRDDLYLVFFYVLAFPLDLVPWTYCSLHIGNPSSRFLEPLFPEHHLGDFS